MDDTFLVLALLVLGAKVLGLLTDQRARGLRNNNPGNIRYSPANRWHGQVGQDDDGFAIFSHPMYGVDAMGEIMDSYRRRGVYTLEAIVAEWAPDTENPTSAYVDYVSRRTGIAPHGEVTRSQYPAVVAAKIAFEVGEEPYTLEELTEWLLLPV